MTPTEIHRHHRTRRPFAATSSFAVAALLCGSLAAAQVQDSAQQQCINGLNKSGIKVASTQIKEGQRCLGAAAKGTEPDAQACLTGDAKGKVGKAEAGTIAAESKCTTPPDFGTTTAAVVNTAAVSEQVGLVADLFGTNLTAAVLPKLSDPAGAKCQAAVQKGSGKLTATLLKSFLACKKNGLKSTESSQQIDSAADLAACFDALLADAAGKIGKEEAKLAGAVDKSCTQVGVALATAFPGRCTVGTTPFLDCLEARVRCHTCLMLDAWDGLDRLCDAFDDGLANNASCGAPLLFEETITVPNSVEPAETPGSPAVLVTNPKLITQFGGTGFSLNNSTYTRWRLNGPVQTPDAILIVVAGFGAGANNFRVMVENLIQRVRDDHGLILEVWGFHRRSDQLEDRAGATLATASGNAQVALDWYYGAQLGLTLHPDLVAGPNRRAVFYNQSTDIPFLANWTGHVFSRDLDVVVELARSTATNANVFLGGHSAGTGFVARYAATDFDLDGLGPVEAGYAKLRGLVLLEGGGGSTGGAPLTADTLDRIEAKFDGGLFGAVRDNAARCVDGTTACAIATEAADCVGQVPPKCTLATSAYAGVAGLSPQVSAAAQPIAIQALTDPNSGKAIIQVDQSAPGTSAIDLVPELSLLAFLPDSTAYGLAGQFLDDDGVGALLSPAVATSMGRSGPSVGGLVTWNAISDGTTGGVAMSFHGPAPTTISSAVWGLEREVTRIDRFDDTFIAGGNTASDWYYAQSGLSVTSAPGVCTSGTCTAGNVGATCANDTACAQSINLDSTALSVGRNRRDIVNLTQAGQIDIPVICFGGSNGLVPVAGLFVPFASSLAPCTAPSCAAAPRVVNAAVPSAAFPTFGDVAGGFEVHISEGLAHNDVVTAEDTPASNVLAPLSDFIARNVQ
jgi:pimeloyl-ACP methyl ester carboxylesterase